MAKKVTPMSPKVSIYFVLTILISLLIGFAIGILVDSNTITFTPQGPGCTAEAIQCPDGTYVGRTGPNCEFQCPVADNQPQGCTEESKICPDGSSVSRIPPSCEFQACPQSNSNSKPEYVACPADAKECPDGSFVGRLAPTCEFAPCR